jgi:hypothetical protein
VGASDRRHEQRRHGSDGQCAQGLAHASSFRLGGEECMRM